MSVKNNNFYGIKVGEEFEIVELPNNPLESANFTEIIKGKNVKTIGFGSSTLWVLTSVGEIISYNLFGEESERIETITYPKEVIVSTTKYNQYSNIKDLVETIYGEGYTVYTDYTLSTEFTKLEINADLSETLYIYID